MVWAKSGFPQNRAKILGSSNPNKVIRCSWSFIASEEQTPQGFKTSIFSLFLNCLTEFCFLEQVCF